MSGSPAPCTQFTEVGELRERNERENGKDGVIEVTVPLPTEPGKQPVTISAARA